MERADDFDDVRQDTDPLRRGQRATDLITHYQQRATELARLRKAAIEQAHHEHGMSYTEIATALGITKGRVTQIRGTAPGPERVFFGVGPVSIGVPYRYQATDRTRPLVAAEDAQTGEDLETLLGSLSLSVSRYHIEPERTELPEGDTVVVCGPKSAPVADDLLARDPVLAMVRENDRWWIEHPPTGDRYGSPADDEQPQDADIAYVARHQLGGRTVVHIAGIHGIGSLGATRYLTEQLAEVFARTGDTSFSLAVRTDYENLTVTGAELAAGPYVW